MLIIPQGDEQLCPVWSAGQAGAGGRAALCSWHMSFDFPKPSSAET